MPWKVDPVSQLRLTFVHAVRSLRLSVTNACKRFGISRKTAYKWLNRFDADPLAPLNNHSTKPLHSPTQTPRALETEILQIRQQFNWGPRKIHAFLKPRFPHLPSIRTIANILQRLHCVQPSSPAPKADQRFERANPNDLWQCDFKGYLEVQGQRVYPFTVLDDHSRFLFAAHPCLDQTMASAWEILWQTFADFGLPNEILCDNAFAARNFRIRTVSWFESRLIRLGIRPCHGRPFHPQTQGKIERLHGTLQREALRQVRFDCLAHFHADLEDWRVRVYNTLRPHEALADQPPITRWRPSSRTRPLTLPEVIYPLGATLRRVTSSGDISYRAYRFLVGAGLADQWVRIDEHDDTIELYYSDYLIRQIPSSSLVKNSRLRL
jgi:transposase InsO family protein